MYDLLIIIILSITIDMGSKSEIPKQISLPCWIFFFFTSIFQERIINITSELIITFNCRSNYCIASLVCECVGHLITINGIENVYDDNPHACIYAYVLHRTPRTTVEIRLSAKKNKMHSGKIVPQTLIPEALLLLDTGTSFIELNE